MCSALNYLNARRHGFCSFNPAVASRRAKNDDDFRVPTLFGAQLLDAKYRHGSYNLRRKEN
jgi:hypothetical protein